MSSYPNLRMRRGRSAPWIREMLAEHRLHPSDLILPLFVCEGGGCEEPIPSLPGVSRWSVDRIAGRSVEPAREHRARALRRDAPDDVGIGDLSRGAGLEREKLGEVVAGVLDRRLEPILALLDRSFE